MKKLSVKLAGAFVAVAFAVTASSASALTTQELIDLLVGAGLLTQDQVSAVVGTAGGSTTGSSAACGPFTRDLTVGSSGSDVTTLQNFLMGQGQSIPAGATGYFGSQTQAALAGYQAANGIAPASGYFGPITKSNVATKCSPSTGDMDGDMDSGSSSSLSGGAGSITDADWVSSLSNEEVGEDEEDVEVAGLEIEADDGSDIQLVAVRLDFTQSTGATEDFEDYAGEVSVWFEGEEVARVDGDEFEEDNDYDKTITLDSGAIIEAGETGELVVAVSGVGNLDTNDAGDSWTVEFESVRFEDASGAIVSDSSTGDINGATRTFSFETFATAASAELKISETDNDEVNKAHMINVHATESTDDVVLLEFELEAEGDSDLEIREFGVDLVTSATDVDDVIKGGTSPAVYLELDGETYGSASYNETAANNREILFDDVDFTLDAGDTITGRILVDLLAVSGDLTEGDTILAQITETQTADTALVDVRDESGEQLEDADITGTATGEANQVYDVTFVITSDGWTNEAVKTSDTSGIDESVTFNLEFDVEAVDGIVYIDDACTEDTDPATLDTTDTGFNFFATNEADSAVVCSFTTSATAGTGNYIIEEGEKETFEVSLTATADVASDFVQVYWEGLNWSEANEAGDRMYEGNLDEEYRSKSLYINNR